MDNKLTLKKSQKDYNALQKLALVGFIFGNDNYKEDVIDVLNNLRYDDSQDGYMITVILRETETHSSTSGIGFYIKNDNVTVWSSGPVITVGLTKDMEMMFNTAKVAYQNNNNN